MTATVNEDSNDKTKLLLLLFPKSMGKLIHNRCTCKLIVKTTAEYMRAHETIATVLLCFNPLFCSSSYTLFQNGRQFSILLFSCKLALVASLLNSKFKRIFSLETRQLKLLIISFSIFSKGFSFSCEFRDIVFQTKMDRCQQCTCWKCFTNKRFLSAKNIDDRVGAVVCQEHLVYSWSFW